MVNLLERLEYSRDILIEAKDAEGRVEGESPGHITAAFINCASRAPAAAPIAARITIISAAEEAPSRWIPSPSPTVGGMGEDSGRRKLARISVDSRARPTRPLIYASTRVRGRAFLR